MEDGEARSGGEGTGGARASSRARVGARTALALGLWLALVLAVARAGLMAAIDLGARGFDLETGLWRLAEDVPLALGGALAAGAFAALVARAPAGRAGLVAALAVAALAFGALLGWPLDEAARIPVPDSTRGKVAFWGLAAVAAGVAAAWSFAARRGRARRWLPPALALVLLPLALRGAAALVPPEFVVTEVVGEVLAGEPRWRAASEHPVLGARAGVLCPTTDYLSDGADLPSLVLAPPGEVALEAPRVDGGDLALVAAAGIDRTALGGPRVPILRERGVRFEIEVDGRTAFDRTIRVRSEDERETNSWERAGGGMGIPLAGGETIVLRTSVPGLEGTPPPIRAGFGELLFVRRTVRAREPATPERPSIVLVVVDTLRADRLSCYGYERETSPKLDALAARGTLYEQAYAASSWTWPSTASILTGLSPLEHGVTGTSSCHLAIAHETLAEALASEGYACAGFSGNPLVVAEKRFDQGFQSFDGRRDAFRDSRLFVPAALDWMESRAGSRFFLYLHLMEPHGPHEPLESSRARFVGEPPPGMRPDAFQVYSRRLGAIEAPGGLQVPEAEREHIDDLYDACVHSADAWVGRVLRRLEELGIAEETVVAFTSDHGEELFDHGGLNHGHTLHGELVRVPLIVAGPGVERGLRVGTPVSNRHLAGTLARVGGATLDGPGDAIDLLRTDAIPEREIFFSTSSALRDGRKRATLHGLRDGRHAVHVFDDFAAGSPEMSIGRVRLFDVVRDPRELVDLAEREPELARALAERALRLAEEHAAGARAPAVEAGDATLELLREIGYVDD